MGELDGGRMTSCERKHESKKAKKSVVEREEMNG